MVFALLNLNLVQAELKIEKVETKTGVILIKKDPVKLMKDYRRIYHKIELKQYEEALTDRENRPNENTYATE